jgi:hypothetical protein
MTSAHFETIIGPTFPGNMRLVDDSPMSKFNIKTIPPQSLYSSEEDEK